MAANLGVYQARIGIETLKNLTASIEEQKLLRLGINRLGTAIDEDKKLSAFGQSYITQGAIDNVDFVRQSMSNLPNPKPKKAELQ